MSASSSSSSVTPPPTQEHSDPPPSPPLMDGKTLENQEGEEEIVLEGEEEQGECGFCVFMKGGGCREAFIAWEKCVEEGDKNEENTVDKCFQVTSALRMCMEANKEYYEPILQAEKRLEAETIEELEREKEKAAKEAGSDSGSVGSEEGLKKEAASKD